MRLSLVIPVFNEEESLPVLHDKITASLTSFAGDYEVLFIDDGSTDTSMDVLRSLAEQDPAIRVVQLRRNYGQTAAMQAGIQMASGDIIVTLDSDLQNDPDDIPMMVQKLDEGFDLVHGWRKNRQDTFINRRLPSMIANWLISRTTGFPIHDLGCTLKAIRREIAQELELYGEMHRFIPILAHARGARCAEVVTRHHARQFGQTSYGISRTFRVVLDLITVKYLLSFFASPMKLFGGVGIVCGITALLSGLVTLAMKVWGGVDMTGNPLLMLSVLSVMVSIQFVSLGLLGEVNARIYYASQPNQNFAIRELVNFDDEVNVAGRLRAA